MKVAVLGAGPGGYVAALRAARLGADVTVIENSEVGGTCLNSGCIPTKSLVASSALLAKTRELEAFGLELRGEIIPDLAKIIERKNRIIGTLVKGIRGLFKQNRVRIIEGRGAIVSPEEIEVSLSDGKTEKIAADRMIIATGSRPSGIPGLPFDGKNVISSTEALELTEIPESLLIIGAGVIGCEFACIFRELGSEVTIVEKLPRAIPMEDEEISALLERELKKKKITLITGLGATSFVITGKGVRASLEDGREISAEKVLVSIGRSLNSEGIGLDSAGVKTGPRGEILVNDKMQTNIPGVYAAGDITGKILLASVASRQGIVAAENIMGHEETMDYSAVPSAIFTSPEIGSVGLREFEAKEKGIKYKTGHFQFRALGKAHAMGDISGFVKLIAEEPSDRILGAHIIGPHATELIHEITVALRAGLKTRDIADTIHAHPTLSEGVMESAEDIHGAAVHVQKR